MRLERAGVHPTDWKFRAEMMSGYDEVVPGQDGAGVVETVGDRVDSVSVGDRVWLLLAQHGLPIQGPGAQSTSTITGRQRPVGGDRRHPEART